MSNIPLRPQIGELGYTSLSLPTCLVQVVCQRIWCLCFGRLLSNFPTQKSKHEGWETLTPTILVDSFPLRLLCSNLRRRIGWGGQIFLPPDFSVEVKLACLLWAKVIFVEYSKKNSWTAVKISCIDYLDEMIIFHSPGFRNLTWRLYLEGERNKHCPSLATWVPDLHLQTS